MHRRRTGDRIIAWSWRQPRSTSSTARSSRPAKLMTARCGPSLPRRPELLCKLMPKLVADIVEATKRFAGERRTRRAGDVAGAEADAQARLHRGRPRYHRRDAGLQQNHRDRRRPARGRRRLPASAPGSTRHAHLADDHRHHGYRRRRWRARRPSRPRRPGRRLRGDGAGGAQRALRPRVPRPRARRQRGHTFPRPAPRAPAPRAQALPAAALLAERAPAYRFDTRVKPVHRALHDAQADGRTAPGLSWLQEQGDEHARGGGTLLRAGHAP